MPSLNELSAIMTEQPTISRRELLWASLVGGGLALSEFSLFHWLKGPLLTTSIFIGKANDYQARPGTTLPNNGGGAVTPLSPYALLVQ